MPDKLSRLGVPVFNAPGHELPLAQGCVGWLVCRLLPEPHNQQSYDLFIGQVEAAWADERVFREGRWHFDQAPDELRTLHHVAGANRDGRACDHWLRLSGAALGGLRAQLQRLTRPVAAGLGRSKYG